MKNHHQDNKNEIESQYINIDQMQINHYHFRTIGSTNTWAKLNLEKWSIEGITFLTASEQTEGRGRFNRSWISPKDQNIYASFCIFLDQLRQDIGQIPQLLAYSALQVLESYGIISTIKWPNDILVDGKKIAGILCETTQHESKIGVICGIGLNVNMTIEEITQIDQPAQSMSIAKNQFFSVEEVTRKLLTQFVKNWLVFAHQSFEPFFVKFQNRSHYEPGEEIHIISGLEKITAKYMQLNQDGSITVLLANGQIKICSSGEIREENRVSDSSTLSNINCLIFGNSSDTPPSSRHLNETT